MKSVVETFRNHYWNLMDEVLRLHEGNQMRREWADHMTFIRVLRFSKPED